MKQYSAKQLASQPLKVRFSLFNLYCANLWCSGDANSRSCHPSHSTAIEKPLKLHPRPDGAAWGLEHFKEHLPGKCPSSAYGDVYDVVNKAFGGGQRLELPARCKEDEKSSTSRPVAILDATAATAAKNLIVGVTAAYLEVARDAAEMRERLLEASGSKQEEIEKTLAGAHTYRHIVFETFS